MSRVLVGISGGIDSAATVLMLQERGFEVQGLYIDMLGSEQAIESVDELADGLGIKLHIARASELFEELVVGRVLEIHNSGGTPSPCTICNPELKWNLLEKYADGLGVYHIATGHYIRIQEVDGQYYVVKGVDEIKDQSYYLYAMEQRVLKRALTPLGEFTKVAVRNYLAQRGFEILARGGESQGVCFAKCGYRSFLEQRLSPAEGEVVDLNGRVVGKHDGYQYYTIGQKRGFELSEGVTGVEVVGIDIQRNRVVIGAASMKSRLLLEDAWFAPPKEYNSSVLRAKIRGLGRNPNRDIEVEWEADSGLLRVSLLGDSGDEFWAVAKGQPTVLYLGDMVVGGGIIP